MLVAVKCTESHMHSPIQIKVFVYMHKRRVRNTFGICELHKLLQCVHPRSRAVKDVFVCSIFFSSFFKKKRNQITLCFNSKYMFNILIRFIKSSISLLCPCSNWFFSLFNHRNEFSLFELHSKKKRILSHNLWHLNVCDSYRFGTTIKFSLHQKNGRLLLFLDRNSFLCSFCICSVRKHTQLLAMNRMLCALYH